MLRKLPRRSAEITLIPADVLEDCHAVRRCCEGVGEGSVHCRQLVWELQPW